MEKNLKSRVDANGAFGGMRLEYNIGVKKIRYSFHRTTH